MGKTKYDLAWPLATKYGPATVHMPNGDSYAFVNFGKNEQGPFIVSGVARDGSVRLQRKSYGADAGTWDKFTDKSDPNGYHAVYVASKWNGTKHVEPSEAARKNIYTAIHEAFTKWAAEHPEAFIEAKRYQLQDELTKAETALAEANETARAAKTTCQVLLTQLVEFDRAHPSATANNCDGSGPHSGGEVRVLPAGGDSNMILCSACYERELQYRRGRNKDLGAAARFDTPAWGSLEVYTA